MMSFNDVHHFNMPQHALFVLSCNIWETNIFCKICMEIKISVTVIPFLLQAVKYKKHADRKSGYGVLSRNRIYEKSNFSKNFS